MYRFRNDLRNQKVPLVDVPLKPVMLCLNESSLNPWDIVGPAMSERLEALRLNRYFQDVTAQLRSALAEYAGVAHDRLLFGAGADQMLYTVFTAVREDRNSYAVSIAPSYFDYKTYARAVGMDVKFVALDPNTWDFDLDAYLALLDEPDCRLAILCHPNNPTGHLLDEDKIRAILAHTGKPVLVDETYFEFSGRTFCNEMDRFPNLIIVRSFSKAFSAAGLRFGYLLSHPDNIRELRKVMCFFNTSLLTQAYALTMLEHREVFAAHNREVIRLRDELLESMRNIAGVTPRPSHTNFITFSIRSDIRKLYEWMTDRGIALRDVGAHHVLHNHLRVTVGAPEENRAFLEALKQFLSGESA
jgi:histidinol-phosphate aminotransferase